MYYAIQNKSILTSENANILIKFYGQALELPLDYEEGKYIVEEGELILNPDWEEVEAEKRKFERIQEIYARLTEIDNKSIRAIRANDTDYIEAYEQEAETLREELRGLNK